MSPPSTFDHYLRTAQDWIKRTTQSNRRPLSSTVLARPRSSPAAQRSAGPPAGHSRFRVLGPLGSGGMGVVYRAYDAELGREVALKSLHDVSAERLYDLKQEFRSLADLVHPNLVELYELHADERGCFFTMELLRGCDLVTHLQRRGAEQTPAERNELLRDCAFQLATAIWVVHCAGKLHRDVKPSNVIVTEAGRVVLLDFGLVTGLVRTPTADATFAGTLGYMAPEQAWGGPLSEAADWYSFGVTLYHAATGTLPFDESSLGLALGTASPPRRAISGLAPWVSRELEALTDALLSPDPQQRPSGRAVLAALGGIGDTGALGQDTPLADAPPITNRAAELESLSAALADVCAGQTRIVLLHGAPGIGKSELACHFVELARAGGAIVLASRCNPREAVVFNAADGLIDELRRLLSATGARYHDLVPPRQWNALIRLFPVLEALRGPSDVAAEGSIVEEYRHAFQALRELLVRLGEGSPVLLWVDDAQWGDADSGRLLLELLRGPKSPALLLLLTYRTDDAALGGVLPSLRTSLEVIPAAWQRELALQPLSLEHSRELVLRMLSERASDNDPGIERWIQEAAGSPFFLHELGLHLNARDGRLAPAPGSTISHMLQSRLAALRPAEHNLLCIVAVAGGRLEQRVLLRAASLDGAVQPPLNALARACLLRSARVDDTLQYEIYHHLIRDQLLAGLSDADRRRIHRAIADAMVATGAPQLARTVEQYEAAEALDAVRCYIVPAANHAAGMLAFDLAARLYQRALELGGTGSDDLQLARRLADCHAARGCGIDAGHAYERAAAEAERAGDPVQSTECLRLASEQYLQAGENESGLRLLKRGLALHGISLPRSRDTALAQLLVYRAWIALRRGRFVQRTESELASEQLDRLDTIWLVFRTLSVVDHTLGIAFGARYLLEALDLGEPTRVLRGLAAEAAALSTAPGKVFWGRVDRMLLQTDALSTASGDPYLRAGYHQCRGISHWFRGRPREALAALDEAVAIYRSLRRSAAFDISQCETFRLPTLALLGQLKRLVRELEDAVADARRRGDRFLLRNTTAGQCSIGWLIVDEPQTAVQLADRVLAAAPASYSTQHYQCLLTCAQVALYEGQGARAWRQLEQHWAQLVRNHFLLLSFNRDELRHLRGRAALALASELPRERGLLSKRARTLVRLAEVEARSIRTHGLSATLPWAALLTAGAAHLRNDRGAAIAHLDEALLAFEREGMQLYAAATRKVRGGLVGGASGARFAREADEWLAEQGVVKPAAITRLLVPGFET